MSDMNKVLIEGNLGGDPSLRYTKTGQAVCNFDVATNEFHKDKEGKLQKVTSWGRYVVWGKRAEAVGKMCKKGTKVRIEAKLRNGQYVNKEGKTIKYSEFRVEDIRFLGNTKQPLAENEEVVSEELNDISPTEILEETAAEAKPADLDIRNAVFQYSEYRTEHRLEDLIPSSYSIGRAYGNSLKQAMRQALSPRQPRSIRPNRETSK